MPDADTRLPGAATTVEIAGRRFPAVALICPADPFYPDRPDADRVLGTSRDWSAYIPAENGVIFAVERDLSSSAPAGTLTLSLVSAVCEQCWHLDEWSWLPASVAWVDGRLVAGAGWSNWYAAEPEWVVETIDRLSRLPFTEPDGPRCQLVRPDHFEARHVG